MTEYLGTTFGLFIFIFLVILGILWFVLPFAVFGIKSRMDKLIAETRATKAALRELIELQQAIRRNDRP